MEVIANTFDFEAKFRSLLDTTHTLIVGQCRLPKNEWNEKISDVYDLCIAEPRSHGDSLYQHVETLLNNYVSAVFEKVHCLIEANFLNEYFHYWKTYGAAVPYLNHLYSCLNAHLVHKTSNQKNIVVEYSDHGIDYNDRRLEIGELAFDIWEHHMVQSQRDKLVKSILNEIDKDRQGIIVNHATVQGVILSFVDLYQFKPDNQLQLYEDLFEIPFFKTSTQFYIQESQRLRDSSDCSSFMERVVLSIKDEAVRIRRYLHPSTYERVELDCQAWLLCDENIDYINEHCRMMVQRECWRDLANLCQLLWPLEDSLDVCLAEFEEYLTETGLAVMQSIQGDTICTQFVEGITEFRSYYINHIKSSFASHPAFLRALDRACYVAVNHRNHPKAHCKSPEMLSKYTDEFLRKSLKGVSETEMDEKLNQIIIIFQYLEDKDIFQRFYSRNMAKRLILHQTQSMDAEESMLNRLKQVCGYEYTHKLNRMFTDVTISSDLNQKFSDYAKADISRRLPLTVSLSILQAGAWPIDQANIPLFSLPPEMEKSVRIFEMFYNEHYCGRKLTWMFHLSRVDLRFAFRKRPYIATMEMFTMGVLMPFNTNETLSYHDLRDITQLSDQDLRKQLQLLLDAKILITVGKLNEESEFRLNQHFSSKRTKFKILPAIPTEIIHETLQTHMMVEEDRRMFIQAAVVRIMKARRELKHSLLIQEVVGQARARFTPRVGAIKRCIEMLIEKQYLERSKDSKDTYIYIA